MPLTEDQLLGRRVELLFVSAPIVFTANTQIYTVGNVPFITPTNAEFINFVSVAYQGTTTAGSASIGFGSSSGTSDWGASTTMSSFTDAPAMVYPISAVAQRPATYGRGQAFWANLTGSLGGSQTVVFRLYGWAY